MEDLREAVVGALAHKTECYESVQVERSLLDESDIEALAAVKRSPMFEGYKGDMDYHVLRGLLSSTNHDPISVNEVRARRYARLILEGRITEDFEIDTDILAEDGDPCLHDGMKAMGSFPNVDPSMPKGDADSGVSQNQNGHGDTAEKPGKGYMEEHLDRVFAIEALLLGEEVGTTPKEKFGNSMPSGVDTSADTSDVTEDDKKLPNETHVAAGSPDYDKIEKNDGGDLDVGPGPIFDESRLAEKDWKPKAEDPGEGSQGQEGRIPKDNPALDNVREAEWKPQAQDPGEESPAMSLPTEDGFIGDDGVKQHEALQPYERDAIRYLEACGYTPGTTEWRKAFAGYLHEVGSFTEKADPGGSVFVPKGGTGIKTDKDAAKRFGKGATVCGACKGSGKGSGGKGCQQCWGAGALDARGDSPYSD